MTVITVREVIYPDPGKKQGKVVDIKNRRWQCWADKLDQFEVGNSYEIKTTKETFFNGTKYVTIGEFEPTVAGADTPAAPKAGAQKIAPPPPQPQQVAAPASDDVRRMDIFVSVMLNNADYATMTAGQIMVLIERYKEIWRMTLGPNAGKTAKPVPQRDDEMDEEIPFDEAR